MSGAPVSHHRHIHECLVAYLGHVRYAERLASLDETVKIKARVLTEACPDTVREVEAQRLDEQYERHPLVVRQPVRSSLLTALQPHVGRYVGVERQKIRVTDPAVTDTQRHHHRLL